MTTCGKRTKRTEQQQRISRDESGKGDAVAAAEKRPESGNREKLVSAYPMASGSSDKKRKQPLDNVDFALKRIKLKVPFVRRRVTRVAHLLVYFWQSTMTRNKFLKERHQKKATPGKKGKRLGGVVKRAMKAAAAK